MNDMLASRLRHLCVVMERRSLSNRWVDHQWEAMAVLPENAHTFGAAPHCLLQDSQSEQWLYPALPLTLHADAVEGYRLNLSAPEPRLFVITREQQGRPEPFMLSVSYDEAARLLDAGETVDGVSLPQELWDWVAAFAQANFREPEPKKPKRYATAALAREARS
jgi:hypothetical protein